MSPGRLRESVVTQKAETVRRMIADARSLPLDSEASFLADPHAAAAGESYLRRALEALLDLGRHVAAKGFGRAAVEYKAIPAALRETGVLRGREKIPDLLRAPPHRPSRRCGSST